jgi:curli biogenesis system outer membrane secretion channel CsgG
MKTFRLIALLALAALAACAEPITAPVQEADASSLQENGTGFLGGGTRASTP